jgi:type IV secretion system protein VirD4
MYPLLTEAVVKTLTGSSFKIADLLTGKRPVTIYLNWPERYLDSLKPLMKLFWGTFTDELKTIYDKLTKYEARPDLHKILFLIDEAGVTPVPELYNHVSTLNGRGMSFVLGIQSLSQLDMYGKSNAETILNNCSQVFSWQESFSTAEEVSRMLGWKSGFSSSHTSHGSEGKQEQKVPLLSPQEIRGMSEEKRLIFHRGLRYAIQAKRISFTPSKLLSLPARSEVLSLTGNPQKNNWTGRHVESGATLFLSKRA